MACPFCGGDGGFPKCATCGTSIGVAKPSGRAPTEKTIAWKGAEDVGRRSLDLRRYGYDDKPAKDDEDFDT